MKLKYYILSFLLFLLLLSNKKAGNKYFVELKPSSSLTIQGFTNVNSFELSYLVKSPPVILYPLVNVKDSSYNLVIADLRIPLSQFESSNSILKNDFLDREAHNERRFATGLTSRAETGF